MASFLRSFANVCLFCRVSAFSAQIKIEIEKAVWVLFAKKEEKIGQKSFPVLDTKIESEQYKLP
jgi:hypothetical protein